MGCKEVALKPDEFAHHATTTAPQDQDTQSAPHSAHGTNGTVPSPSLAPAPEQKEDDDDDDSPHELLFRCFTCKRLSHYAHLPVPDDFDPDDVSPADLARYYQHQTGWKCGDCISYVYIVEHILAWRPYSENAVEPPRPADEPVNYKAMLPREYLVKWVDRSYRRVEWVPHGWLLAVTQTKLKNFLQAGSKIPLLPDPASEPEQNGDAGPANFEIGGEDGENATPALKDGGHTSPLFANPDAERKIPPLWKTVDRVLDIRLWRPRKPTKGRGKKARVESDEEDSEDDPEMARARELAYQRGEEPPSDTMVTVEEFEKLTKERLSEKHADKVAWAFLKWDDLGYDDGWAFHLYCFQL